MYVTVVGVATFHYPNPTIVIKFKENWSMRSPIFLYSVSKTTILNDPLLELVFVNMNDLNDSISNYLIVTPGVYHLPLAVDFKYFFLVRCCLGCTMKLHSYNL
jgi:hypothetical protein